MWTCTLPVFEKILRAAIIYVFLLTGLRLAGKRQLGQMTPFDLVVLLMISNVVQNAMIGDDNSLTGGLIGAVTVLVLNTLVSALVARSRWFEQLVEGSGTVLIRDGRINIENLRRERLTRRWLKDALLDHEVTSISHVRLAILEPRGTVAVIKRREHEDNSSTATTDSDVREG